MQMLKLGKLKREIQQADKIKAGTGNRSGHFCSWEGKRKAQRTETGIRVVLVANHLAVCSSIRQRLKIKSPGERNFRFDGKTQFDNG